jgi:hypothetical protein
LWCTQGGGSGSTISHPLPTATDQGVPRACFRPSVSRLPSLLPYGIIEPFLNLPMHVKNPYIVQGTFPYPTRQYKASKLSNLISIPSDLFLYYYPTYDAFYHMDRHFGFYVHSCWCIPCGEQLAPSPPMSELLRKRIAGKRGDRSRRYGGA